MTGSGQDVPLLPPLSGIVSPPILATGQRLQNFAEVNPHWQTFAESESDISDISFSLLPHPSPPHTKPDLFKEPGAVAWVTVSTSQWLNHQPPLQWAFWSWISGWRCWPHPILKDSPSPWSCLSPGPLCPFSLFLLTLLTLKC